MIQNKTIDLKDLSEDEQKIITLLKNEGKCLFGNIFRKLLLSQTKGSDLIQDLKQKGYIRNINKSSYLELNPAVEIQF